MENRILKIAFYSARFESELFTEVPLGIGYISSYLKQKVFEENMPVEIVFAESPQDVINAKPDVLGVGSLSPVIDNAIEVMASIKKIFPDVITVLGSYHISLAPHTLPKYADIGVLGEGEITFYELIKLILDNSFSEECLKNIDGIIFRSGEKLVKTKPRALIQKLDDLPHPIRIVFNNTGIGNIFTSRGCPYTCVYCSSTNFWNRRFRTHSTDYVMNEIQALLEKQNPHTIHILDDLFLADKKRFFELSDAVIAEGIHKKVSFRAFVRANLMTEEIIRKLKEMNFVLIRFGAETGSNELLQKIKSGNITVDDAQRTIDLCYKYNIPSSGSFLFGVPGETREDLKATYDFLKKNKKKNFKIEGFYALVPFHGTEIYDWSKSKGLVPDDEELDFTRFNPAILSKSFTWNRYIYLNEENMPFGEFQQIIARFRKEFGPTRTQQFITKLLRYKLTRKMVLYAVRAKRKLNGGTDKHDYDPKAFKEELVEDIV